MGEMQKTRRGSGGAHGVSTIPFVFSGRHEVTAAGWKLTAGGQIKFLRDMTLTVEVLGAWDEAGHAPKVYSGVEVKAGALLYVDVALAGSDSARWSGSNFNNHSAGGAANGVLTTVPGYILLRPELWG